MENRLNSNVGCGEMRLRARYWHRVLLSVFASVGMACTGLSEVLVLSGETKTLTGELQTTGITFSGETPSTIVAPRGATADPNSVPESEFSDIHGVAVLSPDGSTPGVIDTSAYGTGGRISTGLTDLVFDTAEKTVSGSLADGVTAETFLPAKSASEKTTGKAITYWKNRKLSDIKFIRAKINYGGAHRENVARTCFFVNDGTTATAQFQSRMSYECASNPSCRWVICVKVEFVQSGDDITARVVYARAISPGSTLWQTGECFNFDNSSEWSQSSSCAIGSVYDKDTSSNGYGIRGLVAGEQDENGGKGITVAMRELSREYSGELANTNKLQAFTYWRNLRLDDIEGLTAQLWAASAWKTANAWFVARIDENTIRATFQRYADDYQINSVSVGNGYVASCTVELKQVGDDVTAAYVTSGYRYMHVESQKGATSGGLPIDPNLLTWHGAYSVKKLSVIRKPTLDFRGPIDVSGGLALTGGGTLKISSPASGGTKISGDGNVKYVSEPRSSQVMTNTYYTQVANTYAGRTIFDGGFHKITLSKSLPQASTVVLTNGAKLFAASAGNSVIGNQCEYIVNKGCKLIGNGGWNLNYENKIFLMGGSVSGR